MNRLLRIPLFLCCLLFLTHSIGQNWGKKIVGEGPVVKQEIDLNTFDKISLLGSGNVYVTHGNSQSVVIEAQKNLIAHLKTEVKGGTWKIGFDRNVKTTKPINFYITVPKLKKIGLQGSGNIRTESTFKADDFEIELSGSGNIFAGVNSSNINCSVSGSGNIELDGSTNKMDIRISGSGNVNALDHGTQDCTISISGSGNCKIDVSENLKVSISGSGDVHYQGSPRIDSRISGSGKVKGI